MNRRFRPRLTYANVAATLAVILALTSPAWGAPAAETAATLKKTASKALGLSKKADTRARKAQKTSKAALAAAKQALARDAKAGPAGASGARGATGQTGQNGLAGQDGEDGQDGQDGPAAASIIMGNTNFTVTGPGQKLFAPSGFTAESDQNDITRASQQVSPNAAVVVRDLTVNIEGFTGPLVRRFTLRRAASTVLLTCDTTADNTSTGFTCNSGASATSVPAGTRLSFVAENVAAAGGDLMTGIKWSFRVVQP